MPIIVEFYNTNYQILSAFALSFLIIFTIRRVKLARSKTPEDTIRLNKRSRLLYGLLGIIFVIIIINVDAHNKAFQKVYTST